MSDDAWGCAWGHAGGARCARRVRSWTWSVIISLRTKLMITHVVSGGQHRAIARSAPRLRMFHCPLYVSGCTAASCPCMSRYTSGNGSRIRAGTAFSPTSVATPNARDVSSLPNPATIERSDSRRASGGAHVSRIIATLWSALSSCFAWPGRNEQSSIGISTGSESRPTRRQGRSGRRSTMLYCLKKYSATVIELPSSSSKREVRADFSATPRIRHLRSLWDERTCLPRSCFPTSSASLGVRTSWSGWRTPILRATKRTTSMGASIVVAARST